MKGSFKTERVQYKWKFGSIKNTRNSKMQVTIKDFFFHIFKQANIKYN